MSVALPVCRLVWNASAARHKRIVCPCYCLRMRYATIVITPGEEGLHPADRALSTDPAVARETIHNINLLNDGTCVTLYELSGDLDRADELLSTHSAVIAADVSGESDGIAYIHFEPNFTVEALLTIVQMYEFVLDTPIDCTDRGGIRVRIVGDDATLQAAIATIPDPLTVTLETNSEYHAAIDDLFATLTARQQEVLTTAVEEGYYQVPRQTTHERLADRLDLTPSTIGEHLRRIEARVLSEVVAVGTTTEVPQL
jgi:hypothetical protein